MTNISNLISKREALNCRFEYFTHIELDLTMDLRPDGRVFFREVYRPVKTVFGMEYRPWLWVWFQVLEGGIAICEEVYSQRTGRSDKSFRRRFTVENSLLK